VQSLKELSLKKLTTSSLDQEDVAWFDACDWEMFPDLLRAILSNLSTLIEHRVDVMKTSPSAWNLLWRILILLNKKSDILNMSTIPFNTFTQVAYLFKKLFESVKSAEGCWIKELNLSNNYPLRAKCVQQILATIPKTFTVERLTIFGAPLFDPAELELFPGVTDTKETPDILQVNATALSASAFFKKVKSDISPWPPKYPPRPSSDFTTIKPHPACIPFPGTVSSIVLFFPVAVNNCLIVPMHIPFAFAHRCGFDHLLQMSQP